MGIRRVIPAFRRTCLMALLFSAVAPVDYAYAQDQKQVIVFYATRRDSQISILGDRYISRVLQQGFPDGVDFHSEYLDAARFPDHTYQDAYAEFLRAKYSGRRFDLVITMHDAAYQFVLSHRNQLFTDAPIVFVASSPQTRRMPNSTGVNVPYEFVRTVRLALTLQPATERVYVVTGADARDREFERAAHAQFQQLEQQLTFTYLSGLKTTDLEDQLAQLPPNSIVYYLLVNRDGAGETYNPLEYLDRVSAVAHAPVYSWVDSAISHGIVGGSLKDQQAQTEAVAQLSLRVLRGESAASIPVATPDIQVDRVDWRQLRRWKISEARVPADTTVFFKEPSAWDRYRPYIIVSIAVLIAQSALIAGLLIQGTRRKRAEDLVRKGQAELRRSYDRIRDLGVRLIHAQDTERARIARELHDDISQQLALLEIDLELLNGIASGATEGLAKSSLQRSHGIARSVHDLSHRLHPAKLRLIGLLSALKALQRDLSSSSGVAISVVHDDDLPPLSSEITLCLFRVVQEALQNAVKYSRAREVTVFLRRTEEGVALMVADDGVGFDVEGAWTKGLGLISMAERLDSIGGKLTVHSRPGQGTRLETTVPLAEPSSLQTAAV